MEEEERKKLLLAEFDKINKANKEGYAGILSNGNLVDRRDVPEARPVPENPMFNVTGSRCIRCTKVVPYQELEASRCNNCRTKNVY